MTSVRKRKPGRRTGAEKIRTEAKNQTVGIFRRSPQNNGLAKISFPPPNVHIKFVREILRPLGHRKLEKKKVKILPTHNALYVVRHIITRHIIIAGASPSLVIFFCAVGPVFGPSARVFFIFLFIPFEMPRTFQTCDHIDHRR